MAVPPELLGSYCDTDGASIHVLRVVDSCWEEEGRGDRNVPAPYGEGGVVGLVGFAALVLWVDGVVLRLAGAALLPAWVALRLAGAALLPAGVFLQLAASVLFLAGKLLFLAKEFLRGADGWGDAEGG